MKVRVSLIFALILVALMNAGCGIISAPTEAPTPDMSFEETRIFESAMLTLTAIPQPTVIPPTTTPSQTTAPTDTPLPTDTPTVTLTPTETYTPTITDTPTATPTITDTPTPDATQTAQAFDARVRAANILIFEDAVTFDNLQPRVDDAISGLGMQGGVVHNAYNASGEFLNLLKSSGIDWDLVIISVESRTAPQTGLIAEAYPHVQAGGALIAETWNLNEVGLGHVSLLLADCGVDVRPDWGYSTQTYHATDYYIQSYASNSPFFNTPNRVVFPLVPIFYWSGDGGDLLSAAGDSEAQFLAGLVPTEPRRNGTIVACMDGRVVLQTFSSHDYRLSDTVRLYQNYIINTLTNRFKAME